MEWHRTPRFGRADRAPFPLVVAITACGTLGMHLIIPALPDTAHSLGVSPGTIQLTITLYLIGLAIGMGFGTRPFGNFSRRRLFGVMLTASAVPLAMIALVPNLAVITIFVFLMGVISGTAYPIGFTIVGLEVDDETRGRVFAFFQSTI